MKYRLKKNKMTTRILHVLLFMTIATMTNAQKLFDYDLLLKSRPKSTEEALNTLDNSFSKEYKDSVLLNMKEDIFMHYFDGLTGEQLKKKWLDGTIFQTKLAFEYKKQGLHNQDEIIKIIFRSYYRKLNNKNIDLSSQIKSSIEYVSHIYDKLWFDNYIDNYIKKLIVRQVGDTIVYNKEYEFDFWKGNQKSTDIKAKILKIEGKRYLLELISVENEQDKEKILKDCNIDNEKAYWYEPYKWIEEKERAKYYR
jgi:hypothetical protein